MMSRILIIDDDEAIIRMLHRMLHAAGHVVQEAASGKAGLAHYRQQPSDVVITDLVMPDMEGLQLIRELRSHDAGARIIAMSGGGVGAAETYLDMALKFGAGWILQKPFTRDAVLAIVAEAVASSGTSTREA